MLIMHVIVGLHVGGAELMLKRLIESHRGNANYRHAVISLTGLGSVGSQLQALGVNVRALGMRSPLDIPRVLAQLAWQIRTSRPGIVQTWMYHADLLGGLAARLAGNPNVIWGIRTTEIKSAGSWATSLVRLACARLSGWVPRQIVCAAEASRRAHLNIGYDAARMTVIPNGFDLARMTATPNQRRTLRAQCGFGAQHLVIGSLGRFNPDKDPENFVRAAGLLARQHQHLRFLMIGRDINLGNAQLAHWIEQTGHSDRFVLLGERADVPVCLAALDIFCLSSRTEGFPNVLGEAMSMGLPCVVTDVGDAALLVADTGVVVPKQNAPALAHGLADILAMSSAARQLLGQKARQRIHAEFSIVRARERFEAIYGHVIKKGKL